MAYTRGKHDLVGTVIWENRQTELAFYTRRMQWTTAPEGKRIVDAQIREMKDSDLVELVQNHRIDADIVPIIEEHKPHLMHEIYVAEGRKDLHDTELQELLYDLAVKRADANLDPRDAASFRSKCVDELKSVGRYVQAAKIENNAPSPDSQEGREEYTKREVKK